MLKRTAKDTVDDHITLLAAGVAFFGFLSVFPAMAALVAIYGLLFDASDVAEQMAHVRGVVPAEATQVLGEQLGRLTEAAPETLSGGALVALLLAIWTASKGSRGLVEATNIAYNEKETRGFVHLYVLSLGLTLGSVAFLVLALVGVTVAPRLLSAIGLDLGMISWMRLLRWPLLVVLVLLASACLYYWAPDRKPARWEWVTPGSLFVAFTTLAVSGLFSVYVTNFGSYNEIYGSLGAAAILLLWLYLVGLIVLLGAELNQVVESVVLQRKTATGVGTSPADRTAATNVEGLDEDGAQLTEEVRTPSRPPESLPRSADCA